MINNNKISLVIPTRNEERNISRVLDLIPEFVDEIIVVDGNSTDNTIEFARTHPRNPAIKVQRSKGKGAALSLGFQHASGDHIFIIDADGSMDPAEVHVMSLTLDLGSDVVKGSRYLPGGGSSDLTPFRSFGNKFLTKWANLLFHGSWTDLAYGYIGFKRDALHYLELEYLDTKVPGALSRRGISYGQGFEIETLMCCRSLRRGLKVTEVPSWEGSRWEGDSNLVAIPDGIRALISLILERSRSKRVLTFEDQDFNCNEA